MEATKVDPLRQNILEAVESLRQRKCRPDRESIAHYVLRKFGSTMNEIFAELENIVDEGGLIKVEYKGTTSYRNPSNFDTKNSPLLTKHSKILNSSKTTRFILTGINELLTKDPTYAQSGVPLSELKQKLVEFDGTRFNEENMNILLEREINSGSIHAAKSLDFLEEPLRVFPKDISMPHDMQMITGFSPENLKDKKVRKPRKVDVMGTIVEARKSRVEEIDESAEEVNEGEDIKPPMKKIRMITTGGRKIVAEKVAEAVRKSYESTTEFETTSAQMIKLAQAVVKTDQPIEKGPSLVLASSIISDAPPDAPDENDQEAMDEMDVQTSEKKPPTIQMAKGVGVGDHQGKIPQEEISKVKLTTTPSAGNKRRGRKPVKKEETKVSPTTSPSEDIVTATPTSPTKDISPTTAEQGLTRSKRDKRKKQVFDPSDLPNTYSRAVNNKKPRLSESPKKTIVTTTTPSPNKRGKKSLPVETKKAGKQKPEIVRPNTFQDCLARIKLEGGPVNDESVNNTDIAVKSKTERIRSPTRSPIAKKSNSNSEPKIQCSYCKNEENDDGEFLTCSTCSTTTHPRCMDYSPELCKRIKLISAKNGGWNWQCFECKTCKICNLKVMTGPQALKANGTAVKSPKKSEAVDKNRSLNALVCKECDAGFHSQCVGESGQKIKNKLWICSDCKVSEKEQSSTSVSSPKNKAAKPGRATKQKEIPLPQINIKEEIIQPPESPTTPVGPAEADKFPEDLRSWTSEDVEEYFTQKGLKEEALNLRRQDMDGYGLLLLQREDIVNGMGFRLGPALKVYRLIHELQLKAPVQPHSSWSEEAA